MTLCKVGENSSFVGSTIGKCKIGNKCRFEDCTFTTFPDFLLRAKLDFSVNDKESIKLAKQILLRHFELLKAPKRALRRFLKDNSCVFNDEYITPLPSITVRTLNEMRTLMLRWRDNKIDIMKTKKLKERDFVLLICKVCNLKYKEEV